MTALEWLENEMKTWGYLSAQMRVDIIQKAKEMEREQLYKFYIQGGIDAIVPTDETMDDFYNQTFNKDGNK